MIDIFICHFQECKIKMTTSSLAKATVELLQGLVSSFKIYLGFCEENPRC